MLAILDADAREAVLDAEANACEAALIAAVDELPSPPPPAPAKGGATTPTTLGGRGTTKREAALRQVSTPTIATARLVDVGGGSAKDRDGGGGDAPLVAVLLSDSPTRAAPPASKGAARWAALFMCCGEPEDRPDTAVWPVEYYE